MKYNTCVSIGEKNPKKLKTVLKKALSKSDFAEIRFDYLKKSDIPKVLEDSKKSLSRCVCTLRPKSEGGLFIGKEDERKSILKLIAEYNPYLLDVEFNTIQKDKKLAVYLKKTKCKLLISWHDFKKTPNDSQNKYPEKYKKYNEKHVGNTKKTLELLRKTQEILRKILEIPRKSYKYLGKLKKYESMQDTTCECHLLIICCYPFTHPS